MAYYSPEIIQKAKKLDLLTYLQNHEPDELVHDSRNTFTTRTHDSLKISNGKWFWFSRGFGGVSALDYLIKVKEYTFTEAMEVLSNCNLDLPSSGCPHIEINIQKEFILPNRFYNNIKAREYLINRGIDKEIIDECIDKELIYEQDKSHNVVFVGYDKNKTPRYAMCRGTTEKRFIQEVYGSHKAFSFKLESYEKSNSLHIFESAIDLLSYATLLKIKNYEWYNTHLLSLAGVYQPSNNSHNSKVPIALTYYLNQHQNINKIYLHLDNDRAGRLATKSLINALKDRYEVIDSPPSIGKDINDFLCSKLNKNVIKEDKER